VAASTVFEFVLGAAVLAELLLQKRVTLDASVKQKFIEIADPTPPGDPLLDACLARVAEAKRRAAAKTWVARFAKEKRLKHRIAERLCEQGVLRADRDRVLGLFTRRIYPQLDSRPEKEIIARLRRAIFTGTREVDPRTAALVSLAHRGGVLKNVFQPRRLKLRKKRIGQIIAGEASGKAVKELIDAAQAAMLAATITGSTGTS
jgi:hypothetical protein